MNNAAIAARILTYIPDEGHWVKGTNHQGARHCVMGALDMAIMAEAIDAGIYISFGGENTYRFSTAFAARARELYPDIARRVLPPSAGPAVASFNDDQQVTYEHIRTVLEKMRAEESVA